MQKAEHMIRWKGEVSSLIYLLEDDDSIRKLVIYTLESQGFKVMGFDTPLAFWHCMEKVVPDLLMLDIMLPEEDGITILRKLRAAPSTSRLPVIILTARTSEYDRVEGLDAGADDYISKPFGMMELVARVRAVLRRTQQSAMDQVYTVGMLTVCPARHEVLVDGCSTELTYKEFQLLCLFVENQGRVLTREFLLDKVWDLGTERENRTLDVHIRTLRVKLGRAGSLIQTVRGVGYRMTEDRA